MRLKANDLDADRQVLLRAELVEALARLSARSLPVPSFEIMVTVVDAVPPEMVALLDLKAVDEACIPSSIADRVIWEERLQSYQIVIRNDTVWVVGGGQIGAIYGFYEFLRRATGIRWYGIADDDVYFTEPDDTLEVRRSPKMVFRGFEEYLIHDKADTYFSTYLRWMVRNGWNLMLLNAAKWQAYERRGSFVEQARCYGIRLALGAHAPEIFLPEATFETHPEWFSFRNGERCLRGPIEIPELDGLQLESSYQPCYTNPEARGFIADNIAAYISRFPEADIFSLWPHDGVNNWCQCETCLETTPYEAMHLLALEVEKRLPATMPIEVLCYSNMMNAPARPLPSTDRTYTLFCPYLRPYHHRFFDPGFPEDELVTGTRYPEPDRINPVDDREYGLLLERWLPVLAQCGSVLGIFAYYQSTFHDETRRSDASRYLCRPDPLLVEDEIARFAECGARVFYDCSHPSPGFWPDGRLYAYLPELLWDHHPGAAQLVDTFYQATLGKQLGPRVAALMQRLGEGLGDRSQDLPVSLLHELESVITKIPGARGERYRLWLTYLQLGDASWQTAQAGNWEEVVALEQRIIALLETHRDSLADYLDTQRLSNYAKAVIAYITDGKGSGAMPD